mgnify:CR=1 FL=1
MKHPIINLENKKVGDIDLRDEVFAVEPRKDILHRVVRWQLAKRRAGTHSTRGISEVSGSTRKPFRQKGTGRARQGTTRAPQHRGGAVAHGPVPHSHAYKLQKKVRSLGLKMALSAKLKESKFFVVDALSSASPKTAQLQQQLKAMDLKSVLFISADALDHNFACAISNIVGANVLPHGGANVHSILKHDAVVLTKDAVDHLQARLA